jgi:hypothetical protein
MRVSGPVVPDPDVRNAKLPLKVALDVGTLDCEVAVPTVRIPGVFNQTDSRSVHDIVDVVVGDAVRDEGHRATAKCGAVSRIQLKRTARKRLTAGRPGIVVLIQHAG